MNVKVNNGVLGNLSVLLIDDEAIVVDAIIEIVGPRVACIETAGNGEDALGKIAEKDYDLLLLDIKMPKMNGREFFLRMKAQKPHLAQRVIFITGDTETELTRAFIDSTGCRSIDKPFMISDLMKVMSDVACPNDVTLT